MTAAYPHWGAAARPPPASGRVGRRPARDLRAVDEHPVFADFTRILSFYHTAEHFAKAAESLFRKGSARARRCCQFWRHKPRHQHGAVEALMRSMLYRRRTLREGTPRYRDATSQLGFLRNNRDRTDCAGYGAQGLIISSAPVEAGAKRPL